MMKEEEIIGKDPYWLQMMVMIVCLIMGFVFAYLIVKYM